MGEPLITPRSRVVLDSAFWTFWIIDANTKMTGPVEIVTSLHLRFLCWNYRISKSNKLLNVGL